MPTTPSGHDDVKEHGRNPWLASTEREEFPGPLGVTKASRRSSTRRRNCTRRRPDHGCPRPPRSGWLLWKRRARQT